MRAMFRRIYGEGFLYERACVHLFAAVTANAISKIPESAYAGLLRSRPSTTHTLIGLIYLQN